MHGAGVDALPAGGAEATVMAAEPEEEPEMALELFLREMERYQLRWGRSDLQRLFHSWDDVREWDGRIHVFGEQHRGRIPTGLPTIDIQEFDVDGREHYSSAAETGLDENCMVANINAHDGLVVLYEVVDLVDDFAQPREIGIMCRSGRHRSVSVARFAVEHLLRRATLLFYNERVRRQYRRV